MGLRWFNFPFWQEEKGCLVHRKSILVFWAWYAKPLCIRLERDPFQLRESKARTRWYANRPATKCEPRILKDYRVSTMLQQKIIWKVGKNYAFPWSKSERGLCPQIQPLRKVLRRSCVPWHFRACVENRWACQLAQRHHSPIWRWNKRYSSSLASEKRWYKNDRKSWHEPNEQDSLGRQR